MKKLTAQQEEFAQLVADGSNYSDALREIRPYVKKWKDKSIHESASKLFAKVLPRIDEIKAELAEKNLWTREQSVEALKSVIDNPEKNTDIVSAVKELNSMHGYKEADEHNHNHNGEVGLNINVKFID